MNDLPLRPDKPSVRIPFGDGGNLHVYPINSAEQYMNALENRIKELEDEILRWHRSFAGHIYLSNEEFTELINKRK